MKQCDALASIHAVWFAVIASAYRTVVDWRLQVDWLVLLKQGQVLLKKFCAVR